MLTCHSPYTHILYNMHHIRSAMERAVRSGFDMIMCDGSHLPYQENLMWTKGMVCVCVVFIEFVYVYVYEQSDLFESGMYFIVRLAYHTYSSHYDCILASL
ncbi:hypothetical protein EON63_12610 [archaeon]|nr:MAG: hypothetical protein EON63_12610 [archaeon]